MKVIVVGLGIQGLKRAEVAANDLVSIVDPLSDNADYRDIKCVPLDSYDGALVCTPDSVKWEILQFLLQNKKHCLVEKPLIPENSASLQSLIDLSKRNNVTCYTAFNHRFEPHIIRFKQILESGDIGQIYTVKIYYGNGTAEDIKSSPWRDQRLGVLQDLGSHLLDILLFLFGDVVGEFAGWKGHAFETKALDHVVFGFSGSMFIHMEATFLSWKNTFSMDVIGSKGSAHMTGLCKWGPSVLAVRRRVFPSGVPYEEIETIECPDPTWAEEYSHFQELCRDGTGNLENNLWIDNALNKISQSLI